MVLTAVGVIRLPRSAVSGIRVRNAWVPSRRMARCSISALPAANRRRRLLVRFNVTAILQFVLSVGHHGFVRCDARRDL